MTKQKFINGDLNNKYKKYLRNGEMSLGNISTSSLPKCSDGGYSYTLDILWGDKEPFIECDTYLYLDEQSAKQDGLDLCLESMNLISRLKAFDNS